jgi:putative ABC transport system ATP-binding protein
MLRLEGVKKEYMAGQEKIGALRGVSLSVQKGEFVAIMGPSGSGKSTMLHIMGLLDSMSGGEYYLEDRAVHGLSDKAKARLRNKHFGFIFQSFYLLPEQSALENVMLPMVLAGKPPRERRKHAKELLDQLGLADRMHFYPSMLSGGQQQRVAIARALANSPTVIFADEPTGNLPLAMGEEIMGILTDLNARGTSIVMVTHDDRLARKASRIVRIQDGLCVGEETNARP